MAVSLTEPEGVGEPVGVTAVEVGPVLPLLVVVDTPVELKDHTLRRFEPPQVSSELPLQDMLHPVLPSGAGPPPF